MGRPKIEDADSRTILYEGASISQLGKLFRMDNRTVSAKLHATAPCGKRVGFPIYLVHEAAPALVGPKDPHEIEAAIKRMHHSDLPPLLQKEFWNGLRAKQQYEEQRGDLWRTADVIERLADVFKIVRMQLLLLRDRAERETELSDKQRGIIENMVDGALMEMSKSLTEKFKNEPPRTFDDEKRTGSEPAAGLDFAEEDPAEGL